MRRNSLSFPITDEQSRNCSSFYSPSVSARSTRSFSQKLQRRRLSEAERDGKNINSYMNDFESAEKELFRLDTLLTPTTYTDASDESSTTLEFFSLYIIF